MNILRRGFSDTITHIKTLVGAAFTGCASLVALYLWKGPQMTIEEFPFVVVGIVGAMSGVFFILIWNIISAPYRIQKERADDLEALVKKQDLALSDSNRAIVHVHNTISYDDLDRKHIRRRPNVIKFSRLALISNRRSPLPIPMVGALSENNGNGIRLHFSLILSMTEPTEMKVFDKSSGNVFFRKPIEGQGRTHVDFTLVVHKDFYKSLALEIGVHEPTTDKSGVVTCILEGTDPLTYIEVDEVDVWTPAPDGVNVGDKAPVEEKLFLLPQDTAKETQP